MATNEIFQYSIISALMDGVASKGLPLAEVLSHGDHGLGTFKNMVGEMIILDGTIYQMKSDGTVSALDADKDTETISPFAMVTRFEATARAKTAFADKKQLFDILSSLLPQAHNHFMAIRVDGVFRSATVRTVGGQTKPHETLTEVGKHQTNHVFGAGADGPSSQGSIKGTIIGFRSPNYMTGLSVAGDHLHFITEDRKRGGHLLAIESDGEVEITAAPIWRVHLELPKGDAEFDEAPLVGDAKAVAAVEG